MLEQDFAALLAGGVEGVLLENDADKPHTLTVSKAQVAWLTRLAVAAREQLPVPLGIGVQRIDWEAALAVAAAAALDFVRLDVFVDRVRMLDQVVEVNPEEVLELQRELGGGTQLWVDVQVKHADMVEPRSIADSARAAFDAGADAVLVTGTRTGEPPTLEDLEAARSAGGAVLVGSGLTPELAKHLAPAADGALVGTALKRDARIDIARVSNMVRAWRQACSGSAG
jgi:membrane complex biogenesis BtpA family protein